MGAILPSSRHSGSRPQQRQGEALLHPTAAMPALASTLQQQAFPAAGPVPAETRPNPSMMMQQQQLKYFQDWAASLAATPVQSVPLATVLNCLRVVVTGLPEGATAEVRVLACRACQPLNLLPLPASPWIWRGSISAPLLHQASAPTLLPPPETWSPPQPT